MQKVIDDPTSITILDIDYINSNLSCLDNKTEKLLKTYQKLASSINFPLIEEQKEDIKNIMAVISKRIDEIIKLISENNKSDAKNYEEKLGNLSALKEKITSDKNIDSKDIDLIVELIRKNNVNLREAGDIIIELTLSSLNKFNTPIISDDEEIIEITETNLNIEDVIALFYAFGINFNEFDEKEQEKIIKYGNLERMESILTAFRNHHIYLNLQEKSGQIKEILIHSSGEIVNNIINNVTLDIKQSGLIDLNNIMQLYINNPSIFIKGNRNYKNGPSGGGGGGGKPADVIGAYDNYLQNRQIFIGLGIDMQKPNTQTITMLSFSNKKIKENIYNYNFYGIPKEKYASTISCLKATDPLSTIDQYIELGYCDYMLNNLSMLNRRYDDVMFYRIVKSLQNGISRTDLYHNKEKPTFTGEITSPGSHKYGITKTNKEAIVKQYSPSFPEKYNEIINSSKNNGPLTLSLKDEFIAKLDIYKEDELRYNFNGVVISRQKVLRLYETLLKNLYGKSVTSIKYCICKYSILTEEQYRVIDECLNRIYSEAKGVGSR